MIVGTTTECGGWGWGGSGGGGNSVEITMGRTTSVTGSVARVAGGSLGGSSVEGWLTGFCRGLFSASEPARRSFGGQGMKGGGSGLVTVGSSGGAIVVSPSNLGFGDVGRLPSDGGDLNDFGVHTVRRGGRGIFLGSRMRIISVLLSG